MAALGSNRPLPSAEVDRHSIFWISVLAVFTAALSFSIRTGASGAIKTALLDPVAPLHSGEMIAAALGNAFLGFALSLVVISPLLDLIGTKRVVLFCASCFVVGPLLILFAPHMTGIDAVYTILTVGMVVCGFGWGAMEASVNPMTVALYPDDKTHRLNILHAWWPAGIVAGGLASLFLLETIGLDWQIAIALIPLPALVFGGWAMTRTFPRTEASDLGVPFREMIAEPFRRPGFWVLPAIMLLTASAELAPGSWVDVALSQTVGMPGILVLVYVSAIMFVMRHFAGALYRRFSDMGLLWACTIPAGLGLYALSMASSPVWALLAATLWALGVCFMWPTMLAATARRYPRSGSWGIGLVGFAGALAIYFVLPQIGAIYDRAKLDRAGGAEAFASLPEGEALNVVLSYAAEQSFQAIATVPAILFLIFGAVWFLERRSGATAP